MLYSENTKVKLKSSDTIKMIVDSEFIAGTNIYYMSDNTSYAEHQINFTVTPEYEHIMSKMTPDFVHTHLIDTEKIGQNIANWYNKQKRKENEKIIISTTPPRTSWLRKIVSHLSKLGRRVRG